MVKRKTVTLCWRCVGEHWKKYFPEHHYVIVDSNRCECECHRLSHERKRE